MRPPTTAQVSLRESGVWSLRPGPHIPTVAPTTVPPTKRVSAVVIVPGESCDIRVPLPVSGAFNRTDRLRAFALGWAIAPRGWRGMFRFGSSAEPGAADGRRAFCPLCAGGDRRRDYLSASAR